MPKIETFDRDLVIEKATEVFHDKGFNGSSMQDLVDATGLNRSSIYNSFGSKLDLFLACLNFYQEKNSRSINKLLIASGNGFETLQNVFGHFLNDMIQSNKDKGCLLVNCKSEMANHEALITRFLKTNQRNTISLFEDIVETGQKDGSINLQRNKKDYALYLYSCLQGFRMTGILLNDPRKLRGVIDTTLQTLK